jgi:hypothetical protein
MNHVLTPFSRTYNLIELGNSLKVQGVQWHLLMLQGEPPLPCLGSWVHTYHFPKPPKDFGFIGHYLVNCFLDSGVNDEDRYIVLTDDDMTEEGFFKKLDPYDDDIIIVSMLRSNKPSGTNSDCAYGTLIAAPGNIACGRVGFEQLVIKGKVFKNYRCTGEYHADGLLIEKLWRERMESFRFVPDAFVKFNALMPGYEGRWNR